MHGTSRVKPYSIIDKYDYMHSDDMAEKTSTVECVGYTSLVSGQGQHTSQLYEIICLAVRKQ